jgi:hypothetical protein
MSLPDQTAISIAAFPSSFRAWFKTAVVSWLVLCVLMSGLALIVTGGRIQLMNWLGLLALSSMIQIGAYTLIGIPFFAYFWPQSSSRVWSIKFSLPIGAFLGFIGMWLAFSIIESCPLNIFDLDSAGGCLYGAAYGIVTSFVAWRLKSANKTLHPTAGKAPV